VVDRIKADAGKNQYLAADIFLAVDNPGQEDDVRKTAERLLEQIHKGTPFSAVARQFSQAAGAGNGGDLGWVQPGQLPEDLDRALIRMPAGSISMPIRAGDGYHILFVREVRAVNGGDTADIRVALKRLALEGSDRKTMAAHAAEVASKVRSCDDFDALVKASGNARSGDMGVVRVGDLAPELGRLVANLAIGQVSPPFGNEHEAAVVIVCDRKGSGGAEPNRDAISVQLGNQRLDMLQRRYLLDLKRSAYVEVRM
jgi:peptidyl-prolyl cis-trans isomerase SurA